jgi:hypothetical protein
LPLAKDLLMKWLLVLLGLMLIAAAGGGFVASVDLLGTETGVLYGTSTAVALAAGLIILAQAAVVFRLDALRATILRHAESSRRVAEFDLAPAVTVTAPPPIEPPPLVEPEPESAPPLAAEAASMEASTGEPAPTTLVGRYSAGGANYSIYSDGSIEAETDQGAFHFASMNEFKAYIAAKRV